MAESQYTFHLIEKKNLEELSSMNASIGTINSDIVPYWIYSHRQKDFLCDIGNLLRKNRSWCDAMDFYGEKDSNCIEIYFDESGYITAASFRIDFMSPSYQSVAEDIIAFCLSKDLVIIDEDHEMVLPDFESMDAVITSSVRWNRYFGLV